MKFEFDHKTGTMIPKKDDSIYFGKSMGGGLIVDDKKNNIKYIIERDDRITKLFGSFDKDNLNFYDLRDSRMIADRVLRMFGREHKYTDYHCFLKGSHMSENFVKKIDEFIEESIWSDMQRRAEGSELRIEDGEIVDELAHGVKLKMSRESLSSGKLVDFDGIKYTIIGSLCILVVTDGETDTYYRYDPETTDLINTVKCFEAPSLLRTNNNFAMLKAVMEQDEWDDEYFDTLDVKYDDEYKDFFFSMCNARPEYYVFEEHNKARDYAIDREKNFLEYETVVDNKENMDSYRNSCGDSFLDVRGIEEELKNHYKISYDDYEEDEAIENLITYEVIEDTEDYFEVDEDGDIDHSQPKFDYEDYKEKYVDTMLGRYNDMVDEFIDVIGYSGLSSFVNFDKLAELIVDGDGIANFIAGYDSVERDCKIDHVTYYIYRYN